MLKYVYPIVFMFFLSCTSIQKYNQHYYTPISSKKLRKDVDYAYNKLIKNQPDLDWFITDVQLKEKFDSLKFSITDSMKPNDFFVALSETISAVRQGHTFVYPLNNNLSKKELKKRKNTQSPLSPFVFHFSENGLLITRTSIKDKTIPLGVNITDINGTTPQDIYNKYKKTVSHDGFNKTFLNNIISRRFSNYFTVDQGIQDTVQFTFAHPDSAIVKTFYRKVVEKEIAHTESADKENKSTKQINKSEKNKQKNFGFDKKNNTYAKQLTFPSWDSTVGILKIRNFSKGVYKEAYADVFQKLKNKNITTLILDLRNNGGGNLADAHELFTYLSNDTVAFVQYGKVNSRFVVAKSFGNQQNVIKKTLLVPVKIGTAIYSVIRTKKEEDGHYYFQMNSTKKREPKDNCFQGKLYVLMNGGSYSASSILISMLDKHTNAVFIGEESGGNYNGTVAGFMPKYKLPHSKLRFQIGLMTIRPTAQRTLDGRGLNPDQQITYTIEEIIEGKDTALEWIKNDIQNH